MRRIPQLHAANTAAQSGESFVRSQNPAAWYKYNTGITVTGQGVSTWADQSGNGRDLVQTTDGNRPPLQADGSILFNGTDEFLFTAGFTLNQPCTYYMLSKQVTFTNGRVMVDGIAALCAIFQDTSSPNISLFAGSAVDCTNTEFTVDTYKPVSWVFNGASSLIQVVEGTGTTGNPGAANPGGVVVGCNTSAADFSNIQVKELIVYPVAHDAATRARIIRYLNAKP